MTKVLIEFNGVYKKYYDHLVLNNINLKIEIGAIQAFVGNNGAGKTTCLRILAGLETISDGQVKIAKSKRSTIFFHNKIKISYAGQDTYFVKELSIRQNIVLGNEPQVLKTFINWKVAELEIKKLMHKYKIFVDLDKPFQFLTLFEQRKVALLRALYQKARILILDEPTVGLPLEQEKEFLPIFKSFFNDKLTVVFSTRSCEFAKAVATQYSFLDNGKIIWTKQNKNVLKVTKIQRKTWTAIIKFKKPLLKKPELILYAEDISFNKKNYPQLDRIDLLLNSGEILGIYDKTNAVSSLIGDILFGKIKSPTARIFFRKKNISKLNQSERYKIGMDLVPENFLQDATIETFSLIDNFSLWHHNNPKYLNSGVLKRDLVDFKVKKILTDYKLPVFIDGNTIASALSNGELQKFVLARTLENRTRIIILINPLMHLDMSSAKLIIKQIINLQKKGVAFILIDFDPNLLELLANRVLVIESGKAVGVLEGEDITTNILNNPLALAKKRHELINKHLQITKSELKYKSVLNNKIASQKLIAFCLRIKNKISEKITAIRIRITGG